MAGRGLSLAAALAVVAASVACSACGGSSAPPGAGTTSEAAPPALGKPLRLAAPGTTLVVTVRRVVFPLRGSGMLLAPGDAAAGVELTVRNAGHGVYDSSSESDVKLRTSAGALAEPGFVARGRCATSEIDFLKLVQPGESRSGCVGFDVPKGSRPVAVRFAPQGRQAAGRTWVVK